MSNSGKQLSYGRYGTNAQNIYDEYCNIFGWEKSARGNYGPQQKLYSKNSAGNNLSVWFIAHSDWTDSSEGNHINILELFGDPIVEKYLAGERPSETDKTDRIVFAKKQDGEYYFLGIYRIEEQSNKTRTYKHISKTYPLI